MIERKKYIVETNINVINPNTINKINEIVLEK
jgi:hypothetical protein